MYNAGPIFAAILPDLTTIASLDLKWGPSRMRRTSPVGEPKLDGLLQYPCLNLQSIIFEGRRPFPHTGLNVGQFPNVTVLSLTTPMASGWALRFAFPALLHLSLLENVMVTGAEDWTQHQPLSSLQCTPSVLTSLKNIRATHLTITQSGGLRGTRRSRAIQLHRVPNVPEASAVATDSPLHLQFHGWSPDLATALISGYPRRLSMAVTAESNVADTAVRSHPTDN